MSTETRPTMDKPFIPALRFHALTRIYDPVVRVTTRELTIKRRLAEGLGDDLHPEMAFTVGPCACVARVLMRLVDHIEMLGRESIP